MKDFLDEVSKIVSIKALSYLLGASVVAGTSYYALQPKDETDSNNSDEEVIEAEYEGNATTKKSRRPASIIQKENSSSNRVVRTSSPVIEEKEESNFLPAENPSDYIVANEEPEKENVSFSSSSSASNNYAFSSGSSGGGYSYSDGGSGSSSGQGRSPSSSSTSSGSSSSPSSSDSIAATPIGQGWWDSSVKVPEKVEETSTSSSSGGSGGSGGGGGTSTTPQANTCTPSVLSGTFGNPFGVNISCTQTSQIKYCLAKDGCCDPSTSGSNYTSTIVVGKVSGNFCLSIYGESDAGGDSEVTQHNYTVNFSLPNLSVGMNKTYYQTTELEGTSFMTSTDFGKTNYTIGQMNFKNRDPGVADLNLDCQEVVENDHLALSPMPSTMLSPFDVSVITASSQVQIPFREDRIDYGLNYIVSYVKNNSYVSPLYSCATSTVTLEDFDYFEADDAQNAAGFEGQFSSYGFFESNMVTRGPAGQSSEEQDGTLLESGLISIFY